MIARIKRALRRTADGIRSSWFAEREKAALRDRIAALPIDLDYPVDPEAKLLRLSGIEIAPMLDIGANTGVYSAILEDLVGSRRLYLFEPLPHVYRSLKRRFRSANVFNLALSDRPGVRTLRIPYIDGARYDTRATLNAHREHNQTGCEEIEVRMDTLDNVAERCGLTSIGLVKIDVEGHELEVIAGGTRTFERFKPLILIEIEARHHEFPITEAFSRIERLGYHGYYLDALGFELHDIARFDAERDQRPEDLRTRVFIRYLNNFFFVHESERAELLARAQRFLAAEKALAERVPKE